MAMNGIVQVVRGKLVRSVTKRRNNWQPSFHCGLAARGCEGAANLKLDHNHRSSPRDLDSALRSARSCPRIGPKSEFGTVSSAERRRCIHKSIDSASQQRPSRNEGRNVFETGRAPKGYRLVFLAANSKGSLAQEQGIPGQGIRRFHRSKRRKESNSRERQRGTLKLCQKLPRADSQSFGNFNERVDARSLFAALNLTDIVVMKVRFLGQLFNAHPRTVAASADGQTDNSSMLLLGRHAEQREQGHAEITTVVRLSLRG